MADQMKLPPGATLVDDAPQMKLPPGAELVPDTPDFTTNTDSEGVYSMAGPDGKKIKVPYSKVGGASKSGYQMDAADRKKYVTDAAADPSLNAQSTGSTDTQSLPGVKIVGRNSAGQPIYGPQGTEPKNGPLARFFSSFGGTLADTATGIAHAVVAPPEGATEKTLSAVPGALQAKRALVDPAIQQQQAATEAATHGRPSEALGHQLAAVVPMVGPWVAQATEKAAKEAGAGNYAGAAGTVAGNAVVAVAPKVIGETAKAAVKLPRAASEAITKTGPRELKDLAEKTQKENTAAIQAAKDKNVLAAEKHKEDTIDALHQTRGQELLTDAKNKLAAQKAATDHATAVQKTLESNKRVIEKYNERKAQIEQENQANEHALEVRRQEEAQLQQDTDDYYAKEDAAKAKAKAAENEAWNPWRAKVKGVTVDGGEISGPLDKIAENSPEIRRMLAQLIPEADEAAPDSLYAQDRAAIMKSQGYQGDYWDLPSNQRAIVDGIAKSNGFEPEPVDFNPQQGQPVPIEQIHRAKSIIGRNIGKQVYEGPLMGEMKQLYKILDQAETRASETVGAGDDLRAARTATKEYQEAFGRERHTPKTQDEKFKRDANPDQFKEENDEERFQAAKKFDPSLEEAYKKVKERRANLKKLKTEDQLRRSIKQVPRPPSVGDLRDGYRLEDLPEGKPPKVEEPTRVAPPDRPGEEPAETKTLSKKDVQESKAKNLKASAKTIREYGLRRALYASFTSMPAAVVTALLGHPGVATLELSVGPAVLVSSHLLANALEKPSVVKWITKLTPKDVAEFEKLPPEQKALFTDDMRKLAAAARAKGIMISPALTNFIGATAASQQGPGAQLRKPNAQVVTGTNEPNKSEPPGYTHVYDPESGTITAVQ